MYTCGREYVKQIHHLNHISTSKKKNLIRPSSLLKKGLSSRGRRCGMNMALTVSKKISNFCLPLIGTCEHSL